MFRQFQGAIAQCEKANIVLRLRGARQRMKAKTGRCEGRKPYGANDGEQAIVARMRELRASGMAYGRRPTCHHALRGSLSRSGSSRLAHHGKRGLARSGPGPERGGCRPRGSCLYSRQERQFLRDGSRHRTRTVESGARYPRHVRISANHANANVGSPKGPSLRVPVISKPRRNSSEGHLVMTKP